MTPAEVDALLALVEPPAGGSALDLGCGPGRHVVELVYRPASVRYGVWLSGLAVAFAAAVAARGLRA